MNIESELTAFEAWYETTYGISLEPEFRANHFIGYVNDKANHRWTAWQARAALSANHSEQVRDCEDWSVFVGYLIDKYEGHEIAEERMQGWLSEMLADPHYGALFRREKANEGQPSPISLAIEAAEEEHGSLRAAAKALGIDAGYLSRLKNGEKLNPGDDVLAALGLERVTMYRAATLSAPIHGEQVREQQWQLIHDTLRNYRMGTLSDGEGGGYPLIDAMTADGQSVSGGIEECTYLADAIWNVLDAAPSAGSHGEQVREWCEGVEAAVNLIDKKAEDYAMEHGHDDMGGLSFGTGQHAQIKADYHSSLIELAAEVLGLIAAAPSSGSHGEQVRQMVEALELAQGLLRNHGFSESDPLGLGAINRAIKVSKGETL